MERSDSPFLDLCHGPAYKRRTRADIAEASQQGDGCPSAKAEYLGGHLWGSPPNHRLNSTDRLLSLRE